MSSIEVYAPGMLVVTNSKRSTVDAVHDSNIWVRTYNGKNNRDIFRKTDVISSGISSPYLYLGELREDDRFVELLRNDQVIIVRATMIERYK